MSGRQLPVFVVGSYMHAFVIRAPRFPRDGETIFGKGSEIGPGGKGSNQAIAAARLGAAVEMLACVGRDQFGEQATQLWEEEGIAGEWIHRSPSEPTGMAFIVVDQNGQNRIIVNEGANGSLRAADVDRAEEAIGRARVLVAQFESPQEVVQRALEVAKDHGVTTVLNPAPAREVSERLLSLVDVATPNEEEAKTLSGASGQHWSPQRAAQSLRDRGVKSVVLTRGAAGAYVLDGQGGRNIPGARVSVVDTTGAGDAFTGALAVALAAGASVAESARFANLGGAFCVTRPGVVPGLGGRTDLQGLHADSEQPLSVWASLP